MEAGSVQPAATAEGGESQGTPEIDANLYPNLDSVPQEYRQHIDPILKDIQGNVGKKFQEHADYKKQWEPFEELGINDLGPDTVGALVQLFDLMNREENADQFQEWWEAVGDQRNYFDEGGEDDPDAEFDAEGDDEGLTGEQLQELITNAVQAQIAPILEQTQAVEQDRAVQEADSNIDAELAKLGELDEKTEKTICRLALGYEGTPEETIPQAWEEYQSIVSSAEGNLFDKKENAPDRPEGPGTPNTSPTKITSFEDATAAATDRLKQKA